MDQHIAFGYFVELKEYEPSITGKIEQKELKRLIRAWKKNHSSKTVPRLIPYKDGIRVATREISVVEQMLDPIRMDE